MGRTLPLLLLLALPASAGVVAAPRAAGAAADAAATAAGSAARAPAALLGLAAPLAPAPGFLPAAAAAPNAAASAGIAPAAAAAAASPALAASPAAPSAVDGEHIVFDVRGSRGGNGDVAAGYLTAADLLDRALSAGRPAPRLTFIADEDELAILSRMTGGKVFDGASLLGGLATVYGIDSVPAGHPPADLVLRLAAPDGSLSPSGDFRWVDRGEEPEKGGIPVSRRTIVLTQTVLGNTEGSTGSSARGRVSDERFAFQTAGVAPGEAGVYADPVARRLKGASPEATSRFLLEELPQAAEGGLGRLRSFLAGETLRGAQPAVAYGISQDQQKRHLGRYLAGLAKRAKEEGASYAVALPQAFDSEYVPEPAVAQMIPVDKDHPAPETAEPGKVYLLSTGPLPHPVFIAML